MHQHALDRITTAQTLLNDEYNELRAEREALSAFREEVATCQPSQTAISPDCNNHRMLVTGHQTKTPHARIRAAYRDTVMSVPHYDDVYGNSLSEDIAAEFGTDLAAGLCHEAPFTEIFKTRLLGVVEEARDDRTAVLEVLDTERRSLARARTEFEEIIAALGRGSDHPSGRPTRNGDSIEAVRTHHEAVVARRQDHVQSRSLPGRLDGHDLCTYLYAEPEWTYPVLRIAATVEHDLRAVESRIAETPEQPSP
jgi:hypothetical protein